MKKYNKSALLILSSTALALGIIAIPVLAGTNTEIANQENFAPVAAANESIQSVEDTPVNNYMNIDAMQNVHNSEVMQEAMKSGDFEKMREAMNSSEIKAQLGEEVVDAMNQMMSNGNMNAMHRGGMMGSGNNMMNW
ncbi:hypothetical protein AAC978_05710 [Desulfitobacterium sp. THU1]|uniref:hypothetical protein n=1 Tax=Desulfitobacterium sp. THU1 TaxID=3138072 RepID=UPI00311F9D6D